MLSFGYFSLHKQRKVTGCRATPDGFDFELDLDLDYELKLELKKPTPTALNAPYKPLVLLRTQWGSSTFSWPYKPAKSASG